MVMCVYNPSTGDGGKRVRNSRSFSTTNEFRACRAETLPHKIKISMKYSLRIIYCGISIDFNLRGVITNFLAQRV